MRGASSGPNPRRRASALMMGFNDAVRYWLYYLALEPYVRRLWPQALISWSRVLAGRVRDPLV